MFMLSLESRVENAAIFQTLKPDKNIFSAMSVLIYIVDKNHDSEQFQNWKKINFFS